MKSAIIVFGFLVLVVVVLESGAKVSRLKLATPIQNHVVQAPTMMAISKPSSGSMHSTHPTPSQQQSLIEMQDDAEVSNSATLRHNGSLPFHFHSNVAVEDSEALNSLRVFDSYPGQPVHNYEVGSLALDLPLAWYGFSYDKLASGVNMEAAVYPLGIRLINLKGPKRRGCSRALVNISGARDLTGEDNTVINPLGARIAHALNDLAQLVPMRQGGFEARLLSDESITFSFIWLKALDGGPDVFFEVGSNPPDWIGLERIYLDEASFSKAYFKEIAKLSTQTRNRPPD